MIRSASRWISFVALLALLIGVFDAQPAAAHGYIVRAIPQDRAALDRAPTRVQYWFSETLEPEFTSVIVRDQAGEVVAEGGVDEDDLTLLSARLPTDLPDGAYIAELRVAFASDGHVVTETRVFFVGEAVAGVAGSAASDQAVPLEVVWKALSYAATILLFGAFVTYTLVLVPAWGSPKHPAGLLPPRVMRRLNTIVIAAFVALFAAMILALLQQTMVFFGANLDRVLRDQLWTTVRAGTRFGDTWNARLLLLLIAAALHGASILFRKDQPQSVRAFWVANTWALALVLGTYSVASHAAGSLLLPWIALLSDWLHMLAVGVWVGGVAVMALVIPVGVAPYSGDARRQAMLAALKRFSPLAVAGLVIVIATGAYNALNWLYTPADVTTTYGGALIAKLLIVVLMIGVGAAHHIALRPSQYTRFDAVIRRISGFIPTLRIEALIALLALVAAGLLTATPVPQPELAGQTAEPPADSVMVGNYTVSASLSPGGPGINTYDVVITRSGAPVEDASVTLQMSDPQMDVRGVWHELEYVGDGLYATAGDEIIQAGEWWTLIDFTVDGETHRAAFDWTISDDASVQSSRPPNMLNLVALVGVIGALIFAAYPLLRRFYRALDLKPATVTAAAGATAGMILIVAIGFAATAQVAESYNQAVLPPPTVINGVLPTEDSITRGETLFAQTCANWQNTRDLRELVERLPRTRDEDVYFALTRDGWWNLQPCADSLPETDVWHIVNYIKAMENPT